MSYALIIFENPSVNNQNAWQQWQNILNNLEDAKNNNEHIEKLHENVWLLPLQSELPFFARILSDSIQREISHHVLFLDEKPLFNSSN